jgi:hypothetical protein
LTDTYDRRVQLDASRLRYKDAIHLQKAERWNGAIYLGGYAIECSLKALICHENCTNNLKETCLFKGGNVKACIKKEYRVQLYIIWEHCVKHRTCWIEP